MVCEKVEEVLCLIQNIKNDFNLIPDATKSNSCKQVPLINLDNTPPSVVSPGF